LSASGQARIDIDGPSAIYCIGGSSNKGVYTIPTEGSTLNPEKISGSTYIDYSFNNSGGTFTNTETVYGTSYSSSSCYACKASATDNGSGPWFYIFYGYQDTQFNPYTTEIVATDMAYDAVTEKIYGWFRADTFGYSFRLGEYSGEDADNVKVTPIGEAKSTKISAMAFDADGNLWGIEGGTGTLYAINKSTGELTSKGVLSGLNSMTFYGSNQSAAYDVKSGKLYWGAYTNFSGTLYAIDLEACSATALYSIPMNQVYNAFYIPGPATSKGAPAATEDLKAEFTGTGTDVKVTCTAPDKTYGGGNLTGELTWEITIDGEAPASNATGKINAGGKFEQTYSMAAGTRKVTIVFSNDEGKGPKANTEVFAGFDTPGAVTGISLSADGNKITISWQAPEAQNGGILDVANLSYTVTRNPGGTIVADKTKELSCTDEIPEAPISGYSYTVTVNNGETAGEQATSSNILVGTPYTIPYSQDFNNLENLDDICMKSTSDDSRYAPWHLGEFGDAKCLVVDYTTYSTRPHNIFLSPMTFMAGVEYTLKFKIASSTAGDPTFTPVNLKFYLVKDQSKSDDAIVATVKDDFQYLSTQDDVNKFVEQTMTFTAPQSGTFSIRIADDAEFFCRRQYQAAIDDIELTAKYPTPMPAENLKAEETAKGSRTISISFGLPLNDVNGAPLKAITKAEIYRGNTLAETIDDASKLTPGAAVNHTIENAPRGYQSYCVVIYNGDLASEPSESVTVMSGYLNNLAIVKSEFPENIAIDGKGTVRIEVLNDGMEQAIGYTIDLLENGRAVNQAEGVSLQSDETHEYTFDIEWSEFAPESRVYAVAIVYDMDENIDDSATPDHTVTFEQKPQDGISTIIADGVSLTVTDGILTIKGNTDAAVYTTGGHRVASAKVNGIWSKQLAKGIYIVTAGGKSVKVIL